MHRTGHLGIGLVLYAPFGLALSWLGSTTAAGVCLGAMLLASTAPDFDEYVPLVSHRGLTHTVLAALFVGLVYSLGGVGLVVFDVSGVQSGAGPIRPDRSILFVGAGGLGFLVGAVGVLGHLAGDALTPMGVEPWRPLWGRHYSLALFPSRHRLANAALFAIGTVALVAALAGGTALRAGAVTP